MARLFFAIFSLFFAASLQAQSVRLIGITDSVIINGSYEKLDTVALTYAWGRGRLNTQSVNASAIWAPDIWKRDRYNLNTQLYTNDMVQYNTYDNDARLTSVFTLQWDFNIWDTISFVRHHYTGGKLDTTWTYQFLNGRMPESRYSYTYGTYGETELLQEYWDPGSSSYISYHKTTTTYGGGKALQKLVEEYDSNAGTWDALSRTRFSYIGNNVSAMINQDFANGWIDLNKTEYTYSNDNDMLQQEYFVAANPGWTSQQRIINTYDNNHNALTSTLQVFTNMQYVNSKKVLSVYNGYNLIDTSTTLSWDAFTQQFTGQYYDFKTYYLYEPYTPASAASTSQHNSMLKAFPNPATQTINILSSTAQKNVFGITIYDATGRSVKHWTEAPADQYQKQVDISGLPSGSYFLRIDNQPQDMVQFTILH